MVRDFVSRCLEKDPTKRWTAEQLLQHEWLKTMVREPHASEDQLIETGMQFHSFKQTSHFQRYVISFLVGIKGQQDELNKMRVVFRSMDADNNGFLDETEIINCLKKVNEQLSALVGDQEIDFSDIMNSVDINRDGRVNYEEFTIAAYNRRKLMNEKNLQVAFEMLDKNGDGQIDRDELSNCLAQSTLDNLEVYDIDMPEESWIDVMDGCDKNNDGFIQFNEFKVYLTSVIETQHAKSSIS